MVIYMESIIYDYYGYNFKESDNGIYKYKGYNFMFLAVSEDENNIIQMESITSKVASIFNNDVVYLIKNKYNQYISTTMDNKNLCLLTYSNNINDINDIVKMHLSFIGQFNYFIDLNDIILLWDQRIEYIYNQCLVSLNFDNQSHLDLYYNCIHAIGSAINSLQYLKDINIDYKNTYNTTLTHRRIKNIDKYELFNPFNYIIDHSSRDLAELYKNDLISITQLLNITYYYNYRIDEYQYLLARLLFPTCIFDLIEDLATENISIDYSKKIYEVIIKYHKQIKKTKEYYKIIINMANIRPIDWLNY